MLDNCVYEFLIHVQMNYLLKFKQGSYFIEWVSIVTCYCL